MKEIKRVLIHIRWPLQSFTLLGFLFAMVITSVHFSTYLVLGFISWFLLCAGITVFNSYYDKDTAPVAGLEHPPPVAISMLIAAWVFKAVGFVIALFLNKLFLVIYSIDLIVTILYSHKNFRLKSNGYMAVFVNFIVGATTYIAASSFSVLNFWILLCGSITSGLFLAAIYLMMQIHQKKEDRTRKDISIMVMYGKKITLASAILFITIAAVLSIITFILSGLNSLYILILLVYFGIILSSSFIWLKKKEDTLTDFKIMNTLTTRLSYAANLLLGVIYIIENVLKK